MTDDAGTAPDAATRMRRLAHDLLPQSAELADTITAAAIAGEPGLAPTHTAAEVAVIRESTDQNVGAILATIAFGVHPTALEPPVGTVALLRQIVAGGGDVTTLLHAYRIGYHQLWRHWSDHVLAAAADLDEARAILTLSGEHMFTFIDGACENLVAVYREHFGALTDGPAATPGQHVRDLVGNQRVDLDGAAAALRYDPRQHHMAAVAVPLAADADPRQALVSMARAADAALLTHPVGDGTWWGWFGWPARPSTRAQSALTDYAPSAVLVGLGAAAVGRDGFRGSHAEAREAARTARLCARPTPAVVAHRSIELAALLCSDPEHARRLSAHRLGPLADRDPAGSRLRETLRTYLQCGRSVARTAEMLHVHQKTVSYRLNRAAEIVGQPISECNAELEVALLIDHTLHGA